LNREGAEDAKESKKTARPSRLGGSGDLNREGAEDKGAKEGKKTSRSLRLGGSGDLNREGEGRK